MIDVGLTEIVFGAALWTAWKKAQKRGKLTPEREKIFVDAMDNIKVDRKSADPHVASGARAKEMFHKLAAAYDKEGLDVYARLLRKRGDYVSAPPEVQEERRRIFDRAMRSFKTDAMLAVAQAFSDHTATGAADAIRKRVEDIRAGRIREEDAALAFLKKNKVRAGERAAVSIHGEGR